MEHVHNVHEYLDQLKAVMKKSGRLIIAVPNYTSTDAKKYGEYWAAYDVPRHLYHFSPGSMQALLKKHGLKLLSTHPQWFDSFYVSLLSEKYKTGKQQLVRGAWTGLQSNMGAMSGASRCSSVIYVSEKA